MQTALRRSPGYFSAVQVWLAQPGGDAASVRAAAARARRLVNEEVYNAQVLVALAPELAGGERTDVLPRENGSRWLPPPRGDLFLQVAADELDALHLALRHTTNACRGTLRLSEEISGGRLGHGREPFGFRDGVEVPSAEELEQAVVVPRGKLAGGSYLLYLRMQQDVAKFQALTDARQAQVIGRERNGEELAKAVPSAHVHRMREANPGKKFPLVRRGFPYRVHGEEGIAFVAASANPATFSRALDAFLGNGRETDALGSYAWAVSGGVFWAPPASWLDGK